MVSFASGGQEPRGAGSLLIMHPMWQNTRKQISPACPHLGSPCQGVEKRFAGSDLQKLLFSAPYALLHSICFPDTYSSFIIHNYIGLSALWSLRFQIFNLYDKI